MTVYSIQYIFVYIYMYINIYIHTYIYVIHMCVYACSMFLQCQQATAEAQERSSKRSRMLPSGPGLKKWAPCFDSKGLLKEEPSRIFSFQAFCIILRWFGDTIFPQTVCLTLGVLTVVVKGRVARSRWRTEFVAIFVLSCLHVRFVCEFS